MTNSSWSIPRACNCNNGIYSTESRIQISSFIFHTFYNSLIYNTLYIFTYNVQAYTVSGVHLTYTRLCA